MLPRTPLQHPQGRTNWQTLIWATRKNCRHTMALQLLRVSQWLHSKFWGHTLGRTCPISVIVLSMHHFLTLLSCAPSALHQPITNTLPCQYMAVSF